MADLNQIIDDWNREFKVTAPIADKLRKDYLAQLEKIYAPETPIKHREELMSLAKQLYASSAAMADAKYAIALAFLPTNGQVH